MRILFVINDPPTPLMDKYGGLSGMIRTAVDNIRLHHPSLFPKSLSEKNITGTSCEIDDKSVHAYKFRGKTETPEKEKEETKKLFPSMEDLIKNYDCVFLSGSLYSASDNEPWMRAEIEWLQEIASTSLKFYKERKKNIIPPVLAICFGHQILAMALGGRCDTHPKQEWGSFPLEMSANRKEDQIENEKREILYHNDPLIAPLFQIASSYSNSNSKTNKKEEEKEIIIPSITVQITHGQYVSKLAPNSISVGSTKEDSNHFVKYFVNEFLEELKEEKEENFAPRIYSYQFHSEYCVKYVKEVLADDMKAGFKFNFQKEDEKISSVFIVQFLGLVASRM